MAQNSISWNDFEAFGGSLKRDILSQTTDATGVLDLQNDVANFHQWMNKVRRTGLDPGADYGIPTNRQEEVRSLLNKFFPSGPNG